ncbi:MAG: 16S rRNA (adenine(1518)-N(6)/adenine(1519)-N(6))-dimethyltransferase RsmA [Actinomycetota bacterium]
MTDPEEEGTRALLGGREIRAILDRHGLRPTKTRGQNFVTDPNTVRRIVRDAGVSAGDLVVEVGPGLGSLTLALVEAGARVGAEELGHGLAGARAEVGGGAGVGIDLAGRRGVSYADLIGDDPAVMVANLPYNVATPILLTALREGALAGYHVMVQREVGERWVATPGQKAHGAVSIKIALLATARIAGPISRQAFHPVPKVDSVTVDVRPRPDVDPAAMEPVMALVDAGFGQRRKLLRNALAVNGRRPADIDEMLEAAGMALTTRAEELQPSDWVRLAGHA